MEALPFGHDVARVGFAPGLEARQARSRRGPRTAARPPPWSVKGVDLALHALPFDGGFQ